MIFDEDELFSISAVAVVDERDELDTVSDGSEWVRQYNDWQDADVHPRRNESRILVTADSAPPLAFDRPRRREKTAPMLCTP